MLDLDKYTKFNGEKQLDISRRKELRVVNFGKTSFGRYSNLPRPLARYSHYFRDLGVLVFPKTADTCRHAQDLSFLFRQTA